MSRPRSVGEVVERAYLDALRRRVEDGPGVIAVARAAGLSRVTVWKMLNSGEGPMRVITIDAVLRIRDALHAMEPEGERIPPPVVGVRSAAHHAWIAMADGIDDDELSELTAKPARTMATLRTTVTATTRRTRRR